MKSSCFIRGRGIGEIWNGDSGPSRFRNHLFFSQSKMAAVIIAARRAHSKAYVGTHSPLMGASGQIRLNNTLGGWSFDIPDRANSTSVQGRENIQTRTQSIRNAIYKTGDTKKTPEAHKTFPATSDIVKDLELDVLVGRKVIPFFKP